MIRPNFFYLVGNYCWTHKIPIVPWIMHRLCLLFCSADIPMNCSIGKNVTFGHFGLGVVLNSSTVLEDNVIIYHGVTIGRSRGIEDSNSDKLATIVIGKNSLIGAHAIILAKNKKLIIGENCEIGAGAVVLQDVPANSIAVGNPARIFPRTKILN